MMIRYYNRLLSQAVFADNGNKNTLNTQLAKSMNKADVQLVAIQAINNDNLDLDEEASMLPPT